jgi:hypothetical protein
MQLNAELTIYVDSQQQVSMNFEIRIEFLLISEFGLSPHFVSLLKTCVHFKWHVLSAVVQSNIN